MVDANNRFWLEEFPNCFVFVNSICDAQKKKEVRKNEINRQKAGKDSKQVCTNLKMSVTSGDTSTSSSLRVEMILRF